MNNLRPRAASLAACLPAIVLLSASSVMAQDTQIHVLCSNGFRAAMEKLLPQVESSLGSKVKLDFGASANLKHAIEGGDSFDLIIVTAPVIGDLVKEGKVAAGTSVDLASTGVGMAVRAGKPKPDVSTAQGMKQTLLDAKSIGYVKVGAGTPAVLDMVNRIGISDDVQRKTVFQPGAEESMASVASGKVDVAFGLTSEILNVPGVQLAGNLPSEFQKRITMSAGISSSTKNRKAAEQIIQSLTSAGAAPAIKSTGMDPTGRQK